MSSNEPIFRESAPSLRGVHEALLSARRRFDSGISRLNVSTPAEFNTWGDFTYRFAKTFRKSYHLITVYGLFYIHQTCSSYDLSFYGSRPRLPSTLQLHLGGRRSGLRHARWTVPVVIVRGTASRRRRRSRSRTGSRRAHSRSRSSSGRRNSRTGSHTSRRRRTRSRARRNLTVVTRAPNTRDRNIVRIDLKREVLEGVRVADSLTGVGFSERNDAGVLRCVTIMLDDAFTDIWDVQKAMQKIRGPVEVCSAVGDVVAKHAHALQRTAEDV
jgi:hypothetical protein